MPSNHTMSATTEEQSAAAEEIAASSQAFAKMAENRIASIEKIKV